MRKLSLSSLMGSASSLLNSIGAIMVISMTLIVSYDTVMRYLFSAPTKWGNETTEYLIITIIFMGGASALVHGKHVRVELLYSRAGNRAQMVLDMCGYLIMMIACGLLFWPSSRVAWDAIVRGTTYTVPVNIPVWPVYITVPIGSVVFGLQAFAYLKNHMQTLRSRQVDAKAKPSIETPAV